MVRDLLLTPSAPSIGASVFVTAALRYLLASGPRGLLRVIAFEAVTFEVAVIGVPDATWGEAVKAICVPKPGHTLMGLHCQTLMTMMANAFLQTRRLAQARRKKSLRATASTQSAGSPASHS